MENAIIEIKDLSKKYRIKSVEREQYQTLRDAITNCFKYPFEVLSGKKRFELFNRDDFWALSKVSANIKRGEVVGVIGRNGAGKTTLLKILSRITFPTEGQVVLRGRVASLLEVGTGFCGEFSGRENIFLNGAILGMTRSEIKRKFDEIVAFAEVEKFIDTPIKRYSSGMGVRLAFAVAAHLEPEILLIDEVLAVGDIMFQKKCMGKMNDVASKEGRTILFVSHNMEAVQRLCSRVILLHEGKVVHDGPTSEVMNTYLQIGLEEQGEKVWQSIQEAPGGDVVRLHAVRIKNKQGKNCTEFDVRDPITIEIEYWVLQDGYQIDACIYLTNERGHAILFSYDNLDSPWTGRKRPISFYRGVCHIPGDFLNDEQVSVSVGVASHPQPVHVSMNDILRFNVRDTMDPAGVRGNYPRSWPTCAVRPRLHWTVGQESL